MMNFLHEKITGMIIRTSYDVMNELGIGFLESVYHNALLLALQQKGMKVVSQVPIDVNFRGEVVGNFLADLFVMDKVIVELKAVKTLLPEHSAQLINYLKASDVDVGLLVNFGNRIVQVKRCYKPPDDPRNPVIMDEENPLTG
jgi:GxxExxY protein